MLSARTPGSLRRLAQDYAAYLGPSGQGRPYRLSDICSAAATGREAHPHRLWVVGDDHESLSRRLRALAAGEAIADGAVAEAGFSGGKRVVFVFSGQGSQWTGMSRALYRSSPAFRTALDACDRAVRKELGWSVRDLLMSDDCELSTEVSTVQPALWAVQVALAAAWRERGVEPDLCLGHSMGEVAAAHVHGALSLDDAAAVICRRSRLMQRTAGQGAMLVAELPAAEARRYAEAYGAGVCVAAENAPTTTVLAGDPAPLAVLRTELEEHGVLCLPVQVNVASHSPRMDLLRDDLLRELAGLAPTPGTAGMVSTVFGTELTGPELTADYWMDNLRRPVRFADTVRKVAQAAPSVFVEVSPHPVLTAALEATLGGDGGDSAAVPSLHRTRDEPTELARAAGRLFAHGGRVDWQRWYRGRPRHVPSLPTYAWDLVRFRREAPTRAATRACGAPHVRRIDLASWGRTADWGDGVAVHGFAPVPPVVYLAAMADTARQAERSGSFELHDVQLGDTPVPAEAAGTTTLQVVLDGPVEDGGQPRKAAVHAFLQGAPAPVMCAAGHIVTAAADDAGSKAADVLDAALARCRDYLGAPALHALARRHGYDIREPFAAVEHLWRREGEAVARVRLPRPLPHVGWEAGLLPLLAARPKATSGRDEGAYVPVSFGMVRFHGELESEFWSVATVRPEAGGPWSVADVVLIAPDRRVLAQFSGIRMRRISPQARRSTPASLVPAALSALAEPFMGPFTSVVEKVAEPFGSGFLGTLLRPVRPPATDRAGAAATARTDCPDTPSTHPAPSSSHRPRRPSAEDSLLEHSAALLGMDAADMDERRSLRDLGLDSLMASQLRQRLRHGHGIEISAGRLLGAESLAGLCASLARHSAGPEPQRAQETPHSA
ncbi:acyltransferase domain-containing protein [Streptomyces sp. NPDC007205]|uniref:acyltransferase domain-containing protein n=1 Tax=Streptomyces sp. NPDC007205 TaxID=3154316 RepID=UPI003400215E